MSASTVSVHIYTNHVTGQSQIVAHYSFSLIAWILVKHQNEQFSRASKHNAWAKQKNLKDQKPCILTWNNVLQIRFLTIKRTAEPSDHLRDFQRKDRKQWRKNIKYLPKMNTF